MMEADNFILQNYKDQQKIFDVNLNIIRKRPTKKTVHDLRVSVKKIRSYLRLQQKLTGEDWKQSFANIFLIFKSLGKLRDFDMSMSLLLKYQRSEKIQFPSLKKYFSVNRTLTRRWAKDAAIKFNEQELIFSLQQISTSLAAISNYELCDMIIESAGKNMKKVNQLTKHFQKNAHSIRMLLKDVYYWLKICPQDKVESFINLKSLDRVLNNLGRWQDHFIFRKKLKHFRKEYLLKGGEEVELVKIFEAKISTTQEELLDKARTYFKDVSAK